MFHFWCLYIFAVFILAYKYYSRNVNFWKNKGVNGPKSIALFGNFLDVFKKANNILEIERFQKYGKIYGFLEMTQPVISISDVDLLKRISIKDFHCFPNRINLTPGDPLLTLMLPNAEDDEWRRLRNIMTPAFTNSKVKQMFGLVNKCVGNTLSYFDDVAKSSTEIELKETFLLYAIDTVGLCAFGVETNSFKNLEGEFVRHAKIVIDFRSLRVMIGLLLPNKLRQTLGFQLYNPSSIAYFEQVMKHVLNEKRGHNKNNEKTLLSLLLNAEKNDVKNLQEFSGEGFSNSEILDLKNNSMSTKLKLTEKELLAQCIVVILAGVETTSSTLNYLVHTLAVKPEIQEQLYLEVKHYFDNEKYEYDSLSALPYLDAVVNETFRYFSPICQYDRVCSCDYKLGDTGIVIPKGTVVNMPIHVVHHDPEYWNEPFEFKPERFLPENKHLIKPYTFIPFGIGPRICIGMKLAQIETKTMISKLVYNFKILKTKNTVMEPVYNGIKLISTCKPLYITLEHRE